MGFIAPYWHQLLYQDGTFPDGVSAKVGTTAIGAWADSPPAVQYGNGETKPDFAHLSHMHITVDEK